MLDPDVDVLILLPSSVYIVPLIWLGRTILGVCTYICPVRSFAVKNRPVLSVWNEDTREASACVSGDTDHVILSGVCRLEVWIVVRGGGTRDNLGGGAKQNGQSGIVRGLVLGTMYA